MYPNAMPKRAQAQAPTSVASVFVLMMNSSGKDRDRACR